MTETQLKTAKFAMPLAAIDAMTVECWTRSDRAVASYLLTRSKNSLRDFMQVSFSWSILSYEQLFTPHIAQLGRAVIWLVCHLE